MAYKIVDGFIFPQSVYCKYEEIETFGERAEFK